MTLPNVRRFLKFDYLILPLILALAFYLTFLPHLNYPYPVHLDEWLHLAGSNQIIKQASAVGLSSPFDGGGPTFNQRVEFGFYVLWSVFYQISGIPWIDIFRYFPGIIFMITVLSVYALTRRLGFGWEAAFFTCLITTTVGILGPAFLVPAAMALLFIPLSLFLVFNFKTWWCYLALLIFIGFLSSIHSATALALTIILIPSILLNLKGDFRHSLGIALTLAIPLLAAFLLMSDILLPVAKSLLAPKPLFEFVDLPGIISTYGYLPVSISLLGTFLLAIRGEKQNSGLILGLLTLLLVLATYFTFHYGIGWFYYRGLTVAMLMISIVAGAGLAGVRSLKLPARFSAWLRMPFVTKNAGNFLCLILIGLTLYMAIPARQKIPYYHMIDDEDYQAFVWIRDNVDISYTRAILDPWKGSPFTALTGRYVYSLIGEFPKDKDLKAYDFLQNSGNDTAFLKDNGISIVYSKQSVDNPDLTEVRRYVYLLKETEGK